MYTYIYIYLYVYTMKKSSSSTSAWAGAVLLLSHLRSDADTSDLSCANLSPNFASPGFCASVTSLPLSRAQRRLTDVLAHLR